MAASWAVQMAVLRVVSKAVPMVEQKAQLTAAYWAVTKAAYLVDKMVRPTAEYSAALKVARWALWLAENWAASRAAQKVCWRVDQKAVKLVVRSAAK